MDKYLNNLVDAAELGEEATAFIHSQLGRYIIGKLEDEKESAINELMSCDPNNPDKIYQLQNTINRSNSFKGWLIQAIEMGDNAIREYTQED